MNMIDFEASRVAANAAARQAYLKGGHRLESRPNLTSKIALDLRCKAERRVPTQTELDAVTDFVAVSIQQAGGR